MKKGHWIGAVVILIIGYVIGVMYPKVGNGAISKVKGIVGGAAGA